MLDNIRNTFNSSNQISQRSSQVSFVPKTSSTLSSLINSWSTAKSYVSSPISKFVGRKLVAFDICDLAGKRRTANICVDKIYEKGSIATYARSAVGYGWDLATSFLGQYCNDAASATGINKFGRDYIAPWFEGSAKSQIANYVFLPLITLMHEKAAEQMAKSAINLALDSTALWAVGGLGMVENLNQLKKAATVANKVASYAKLGAATYVYGQPAYYVARTAVDCCLLKRQKERVDAELNNLNLDPVSKQVISTLLITIMEAGSFTTFDPKVLLGDAETVARLITIASQAKSLKVF